MKNKSRFTLAFAFLMGYFISDIVDTFDTGLVSHANADVAGMSHFELKQDRDFQKAVRSVIGAGYCYVRTSTTDEHVYCD